MTLTTWNPVTELPTVEIERLNRMFDRIFTTEPSAGVAWTPAVDIYETATKDVVIKAELPEMTREGIRVTFENDVLAIEGERKPPVDEKSVQLHRSERVFGTFHRQFTLPSSVDGARIAASYQDGVLTITLPRREESKPRQIQING